MLEFSIFPSSLAMKEALSTWTLFLHIICIPSLVLLTTSFVDSFLWVYICNIIICFSLREPVNFFLHGNRYMSCNPQQDRYNKNRRSNEREKIVHVCALEPCVCFSSYFFYSFWHCRYRCVYYNKSLNNIVLEQHWVNEKTSTQSLPLQQNKIF